MADTAHSLASSVVKPLQFLDNAFSCFHSSGAHLYLHSFPTRRSSDLLDQVRLTCASASRQVAPSRSRMMQLKFVPRPRSEEHTSELQSLRHLVCRLLLEKKKQKRKSDRVTWE